MGLRYNPFNGSFDFTRSPGSYLDGEVATFADLPLDTAAAPLNSAWLVREASGLWLVNRKPAGIYIRTATGGTDRNADYTYASAFPDVFSDANFVLYDNSDSTKNLQFDLSGLTTGATRTLTVPDASGTIALNPMTAAGDIIVGGTAGAPARLGIGTAAQQLRVNSGATGLEYFTPAAAFDPASPAAIGSTTPNTGAFTSLTGTGLTINGTSDSEVQTALRGRAWYGSFDGSNGIGVEALASGIFGASAAFTSFTGHNQAVTLYNSVCFTAGFFAQVFMHTNGNTGIRTADPQERLDVAGVIQARNGATATEIRAHNTWSSSTNFERGFMRWSGSVFQVGTEKGSGGGSARNMEFRTDNVTRLTIGSGGGFTLADAQNVAVGTTTGTRIGTATNQRLGFFNATPVVQPAAVADATDAASTQARLNDLLARLRTLGLIAT